MFDFNENPFISLIFKISRKTFTTLFSQLEKLKIHPGQLPILLLLLKQDNLSQIEIANKVCVKPSTIAVVLRKMEKNDLIEKMTVNSDRRTFYIKLTEKGKEIANKTSSIIDQLENKITISLSSKEKENLINCLNKIIEKLDELNIKK